MYTVDTDIKDLQAKDRVISKLYFSMNSPQIATPELGTEEALCYIMLFKAGNSYSSYIGLYLPTSDRRFFYSYSGNPLSEDRLNEVMEESNQFAEEMGFLLDELKLAGMSVDERNRWIEDQPFFGYTKKTEEKPEEAPAGTEEEKPVEAAAAQDVEPVEQPVVAAGTATPVSPGSVPVEEEITSPSPPPPPVEPVQETAPRAQMTDMALDPFVEAPLAEEPDLPVPPAQKQTVARQKSMRTPPPAIAAQDEEEGIEAETQTVNQRDTPARAQKRQKKGQHSSAGTVNKEYEALARLLASF